MPGPEIRSATRVVAAPEALDECRWPADATVLRIASDEVLVLDATGLSVDDPYALVQEEEGICAVEMSRRELEDWMAREAEWPLPTEDSFFAQGMAAGLPVKIVAGGENALVLTWASLSHELEGRL